MIPHTRLYEDDRALKSTLTAADNGAAPRFNWRDELTLDDLNKLQIRLRAEGQERAFELEEVADAIGEALTRLLRARKQNEIYTNENRQRVARLAEEAARRLHAAASNGHHGVLSRRDVDDTIERILVENDAHDLAHSHVMGRQLHGGNPMETMTVRVIRRNGQVVPWRSDKVEIAVRRAFLALHLDSDPAEKVAAEVGRVVAERGVSYIHIEEVQDLVQEALMRLGHYKVAEAFILYRAERARSRLEEGIEEVAPPEQQDSMIVVEMPDGTTRFWDGIDLRKRIAFATIGLNIDLTADEIEVELRRSLYPEMKQEDLKKTLLLNAKTLIERDADFAKFAGRILLTFIYEEVLDWDIVRDGIDGLKEAHRRAFRAGLRRGVEIERLDARLLDYDLERLADAIDPAADLDFDYLGIQTLYDRYLIVDKKAKPSRRLETPQLFWLRVAMGLFLDEKEDREGWVIRLYGLYKSRRFCSSTPTLFNSGTPHSQLSSCYLYKVDDNLDSIMIRGIAENAMLSKWAGGLGGSWTSVRGTGSYIKGTNGESQGVIPFLKLHNDQLVAVNQGGKRRGSGCAYLETWHNDLLDFLELRRNTGDDRRRTHDMNTANWIPDLFMQRMEARADWTLFHASEVPELHELYGRAFREKYEEYEAKAQRGEVWSKTVPAIELWKQMLRMLFETGHPWITFKDPCNVRSPQDHAGVVHSSNLCTEITLNTSEDETAVCNLGSVVLESHIDSEGKLNHERLRETISVAVRALDNVIDLNFYPTQAAKTANSRHRPVGLGVMGLQNALYLRGESFASQEAVEFNDEFMEAIAYYAYEASSDLAGERGTYQTYTGSKWDRGLLPCDTVDLLEEERGETIDVPRQGRMDWQPLREKIAKQGMRNSNVLAIAPTATISNIMGSSPCIEPTYKNLFVKSNLSGDFIVLNQHLVRDLKERGLWTQQMRDDLKYFDGEIGDVDAIPDDIKQKYLTAFSIHFDYFIDAAARRQKWIDQSQSVNLFLGEPDLKTLSHMYRAAWRKGLKTTYYLRTLGASNIEKATVSKKKELRGVTAKGLDGEGSPLQAEPGEGNTGGTPVQAADQVAKATPSEAQACRLDAMMNGSECEACQ